MLHIISRRVHYRSMSVTVHPVMDLVKSNRNWVLLNKLTTVSRPITSLKKGSIGITSSNALLGRNENKVYVELIQAIPGKKEEVESGNTNSRTAEEKRDGTNCIVFSSI